MKFLANENFMASGVRVLRNAGLDVVFIGEDSPSIKDWEVMEIAIATNRTILTHDRDYGELVFKYGYRPSAGVIYFRMKDYLPEEPARMLLQLLADPNFAFEYITPNPVLQFHSVLQLLADPNFAFEGLHTVIDKDGSTRQRPIPVSQFPGVDKPLGPEMKSTGEAIYFIKDLKDPYFRELERNRSMYLYN